MCLCPVQVNIDKTESTRTADAVDKQDTACGRAVDVSTKTQRNSQDIQLVLLLAPEYLNQGVVVTGKLRIPRFQFCDLAAGM